MGFRFLTSDWRYLLSIELIVILLIKIVILTIISHVCFVKPLSEHLTSSSVYFHIFDDKRM
jgi:hypothetical protein